MILRTLPTPKLESRVDLLVPLMTEVKPTVFGLKVVLATTMTFQTAVAEKKTQNLAPKFR